MGAGGSGKESSAGLGPADLRGCWPGQQEEGRLETVEGRPGEASGKGRNS